MPITLNGTTGITSPAIDLTTALPAVDGGTGLTSPGTSGNVLTSNGSAWVSSTPASPTGTAKAWVLFQGGLGNTAGVINGSFNVSSITVNTTGDYTVNFTTALASANYSAVASTSGGDANSGVNPATAWVFASQGNSGAAYSAPTSSSFRICLYNTRNNTFYNAPTVQAAVFI